MKLIRVTSSHIANGKPRSYCECPVALAMMECTGETWFVTPSRVDRVYALPDVARQFIADFDAGRSVGPFEFELPLAGE